MPISDNVDYIVPQTVIAAPPIKEFRKPDPESDNEPIAPPGKLSDKCIMLTAVIAPFVGLVVSIVLLWQYGWMGLEQGTTVRRICQYRSGRHQSDPWPFWKSDPNGDAD